MRFLRPAYLLLGLTLLAASVARADEKPSFRDLLSPWRWDQLVDSWPDLLDQNLPSLKPSGAVKVYVRPHFGDFFRKDYVRIPVGVRVKVAERIELSSEVEGYLTHGLRDSFSKNGFSTFRVGSKYEQPLACGNGAALSTGVNFSTPLSRPPVELTDGLRHTQPYVAMTRPIFPQWKLVGFGTIGADLLDMTHIQTHFGKNQLHTNALGTSFGVTRDWTKFTTSLTLSYTTSELISDESASVVALRPEMTIPFTLGKSERLRWYLTLGARGIHGLDGNEFGVSSSLRVEFQNRKKAK